MTAFEEFALDHNRHRHCIVCQGCILDPSPLVQGSWPLWCIGCARKTNNSFGSIKAAWITPSEFFPQPHRHLGPVLGCPECEHETVHSDIHDLSSKAKCEKR